MASLALPLVVGCSEADNPVAPAPCYEKQTLTTVELCEQYPDACPMVTGQLPTVGDATVVVPDATAMPEGVVSQDAHNNLDIVEHNGRLFFAFRTAPSHFASPEVVMYVVSTTDQKEWVLEARYALQKDLREPRFLPIGDDLYLYFAVLGEITLSFLPERMVMSQQMAGCQWTEPETIEPTGEAGFIPWRARYLDGTGYLMGYVGGEDVVAFGESGLHVHFLKTSDGRTFEPVIPGRSAILIGGASETDWAFLDDGSMLTVSRNEAGDELGFGSKICRGRLDGTDDFTCAADPKKYDSPLVINHGGDVYLIGRRHLANEGNYDLMMTELPKEDQAFEYQKQYWAAPKRCALWQVDPDALTVSFISDLPSAGDTCFASAVPLSDSQYLVYNYSSPFDDPDINWNDGQFGETLIYRLTLTLP